MPAGFLGELLEYRYLARAIAIYEQNPKAEGALVQFVRELDFELAQDAIHAKQ